MQFKSNMTKNVVGRLLNLENEMKTVLSICELSNNEMKNGNGRNLGALESSKGDNSQRSSRVKGTYTQLRETKIPSGGLHKKYPSEKPASDPAAVSKIKEMDVSSRRKNGQYSSLKQNTSKGGESSEVIESTKFPKCSHDASLVQGLRPAEEILSDISQYGSDKHHIPKRMGIWCSVCRRRTFECLCRDKICKLSREDENVEREIGEAKESFIRHIKPNLQENPVIMELAKRMERKEKETLFKSEDYRGKMKYAKKDASSEYDIAKRPASASFKPRETTPNEGWNKLEEKNVRHKFKKKELEGIPEEQMKMESLYQCSVDCTENMMTASLVENMSAKEVTTLADCEQSPTQGVVNNKKGTDLSEETTLKIAEIIEKNHQKIEEMRKAKFAALTKLKYMKDKYDKLINVKDEMEEKMEKLVDKNETLVKELKEAEKTKEQILEELEYLRNAKTTQRSDEERDQLEDKPEEERKVLANQADNPSFTGSRLEICPGRGDSCEHQNLYRRQEAVYRRLVHGLSVLERVIKNNRAKEKRANETKVELARKRKKNLEKLHSEKKELIRAVNQLREERRLKIEEIVKKDGELEKTKKSLKEKSDALEETSRELESIRGKSIELEEQVKALRKSIENFEAMHQSLLKERQSFEEVIQRIEGENSEIQEQLNNEKDSVMIKNKIIQDQQETIKQLREKSQEAKGMARKLESLERLINIEREEKLELQETIERLKRKKDELKQKVKSLEADLLLAPQEVVRDLQKTQIVLHELENQVQVKQKEWEVILQSLAREKEQACSVAAFATKKLIQTTNDFQRHSDAQKKLYRILTENLVEKKRRSQEGQGKVSVRFSDDLEQEGTETENTYEPQVTERSHGSCKLTGILKKCKEQ